MDILVNVREICVIAIRKPMLSEKYKYFPKRIEKRWFSRNIKLPAGIYKYTDEFVCKLEVFEQTELNEKYFLKGEEVWFKDSIVIYFKNKREVTIWGTKEEIIKQIESLQTEAEKIGESFVLSKE